MGGPGGVADLEETGSETMNIIAGIPGNIIRKVQTLEENQKINVTDNIKTIMNDHLLHHGVMKITISIVVQKFITKDLITDRHSMKTLQLLTIIQGLTEDIVIRTD